MDKKKVTRRAVIGTAIGGLAVSPLIFRALKGPFAKIPENALADNNPMELYKEYKKNWQLHKQSFGCSIREISGPSKFSLNYNPRLDQKYYVKCLNASYNHISNKLDPKVPASFKTVDGCLVPVSPVVDSKPSVLLEVQKGISETIGFKKAIPSEKCIAVLTDNNAWEYLDAAHKAISYSNLNRGLLWFSESLIFYCPNNQSLEKKSQWTIPARYFGFEVSCKVTGFAEIANAEVVKIEGKQQLDNKEYQQSIKNNIRLAEKQTGYSQEKILLEKSLKKAIDRKLSKAVSLVSYIDLKTGMLLRRDWRSKVHSDKSSKWNRSAVTISQITNS